MEWFKDLDGNAQLISATNARRDFGMDTSNASMGNMSSASFGKPSPYSMKLPAIDANSTLKALDNIATSTALKEQALLVCHRTYHHRVEYHVTCTRIRGDKVGDEDSVVTVLLKEGKSARYRLTITHRNERQTEMVVTIVHDRNGFYWLTVLANPTSLLLAYNAFAVAVQGKPHHAEWRMLMRVPFAVLKRIIQSQNKNFNWHPDTQARLKDLAFRNCPAQVFTYVMTAPKSPAQFLGFLRALYSVPYSDRTLHRLLCDDLGFEMESKMGPNGVQTLLLRFRHEGRLAWSVNFYDKLAKATADAAIIRTEVGDEAVCEFLSKTVRVDVTIHEYGQRAMQKEAGIVEATDKATLSAADYVRAIKLMNQGNGRSGKRFIRWLLDHIFEKYMKLWVLLDYRPSKLDQALKSLKAYDEDAHAAFSEWIEQKFCATSSPDSWGVSFVTFLTEHPRRKISRAVARAARQKLLDIGLDPDVPLRAYDAFFESTFSWDLSDDDRHRLAKARESGDARMIQAMQKRSRGHTEDLIDEIRSSFQKMIKSAHTPATMLPSGTETQ